MNGQPSRELTRQERAAIRRLVTDLCANHDNQDRLCLPLDCPCYMLHKWWAGSFCRYFPGGGAAGGPGAGICHYRRGHFPETENMPGLRQGYLPTSQAYCSDSCRAFARRKSERERKRRIRQN